MKIIKVLRLVIVLCCYGSAEAEPQCELEKIALMDASTFDSFGTVSICGERVLIGARGKDGAASHSGSAYIFDRVASQWVQTMELLASDGSALDSFGRAVALEGDRAFVGAQFHSHLGLWSGAVYVFELKGAKWTEVAELLASDGEPFDQFGNSLAVSGARAAIGARGDDNTAISAGAVYVFEHDGATWNEVAKLTASDGNGDDEFGESVAIDGGTILVGTIRDSDLVTDGGAAYIFERTSSGWVETAKLTPIPPSAPFDHFGESVAISGDLAIVAAPNVQDIGSGRGAVYVFERSRFGWTQTARLTSPEIVPSGIFRMVTTDGERVVVGADGAEGAEPGSGAVYVFERKGPGWSLAAKVAAADGNDGDFFGRVALSGGLLAVGAIGDSDVAEQAGSAYVFGLSLCGDSEQVSVSSTGAQTLDLTAGTAHAGDVYLLLGSLSATSPGIPIDGHILPLAPDPYFVLTLLEPNGPTLERSVGFLDEEGKATARFSIPEAAPPALAGLTAFHAYLVLHPRGVVTATSNAFHASLVP